MAYFGYDTFTEASTTGLNVHTPDTGTGWTANTSYGSPIPSIVGGSGKAVVASGGSPVFYYLSDTPPSADYTVTASVSVGGSGDYAGVIARCATGSLECIAAWLNGGNAVIYRYGGAGNGQRASAAYSYSYNTFYDVSLSFIGSNLTMKVNGVTVATSTDLSITAAGKAGIVLLGNAEVNTFAAGDPPAAATSLTPRRGGASFKNLFSM